MLKKKITKALLLAGILSLIPTNSGAIEVKYEIPTFESMQYDGEWSNLHKRLYKYSENDNVLCLALNAYHEARNSTIYDQIAITHVVLNRSQERNLEICDTIWEKHQFSWTIDGKSDYPYEIEAWDRAITIAKVTYAGDAIDATNGANHYHAKYVKPSWSKRGYDKINIGKHVFMKL